MQGDVKSNDLLKSSLWKELLHCSTVLGLHSVYVLLQERTVIEMHDKLQRGPPRRILLGFLCFSHNITVQLSLLLLGER